MSRDFVEFWWWHRPHDSDVEYLTDGPGNTLVRTDPEEPPSEYQKRLMVAAPKLLAALKRIGAIEPRALDEDALDLIRSIEEAQ